VLPDPFRRCGGVASGGGGKWGHTLWGADLGGAPAHFLQSLKKNAF